MSTNAQVQTRSEVVVFHQPRLPYHDAINERFGVDRAGWKALTEAIFPNAKTSDSVIMALSYCRARKLDPFKRPVHIVPMWSSVSRSYVETVWPGISELRTTAFRTGQYAGKGETEFGPDVTRTFTGTVKDVTKTIEIRFPEWARVKITRVLNGRECTFASPKVFWLEAYAKWGNTEVPNDMWAKRPSGQLEKCVEAAALRCAFPEEIGNDLAAEEMDGQRIIDDGAATVARNDDGPPPPPRAPRRPAERTAAPADEKTRPVEEPPVQEDVREEVHDQSPPPENVDEVSWLNDVEGALSGCETLGDLGEMTSKVMAPQKGIVSAETWERAQRLAEDTYFRIARRD